jgi:hypothetical protein
MVIAAHRAQLTQYLTDIGLPPVRSRDVTANVLLSRRHTADLQLSALGAFGQRRGTAQLWGGPTSTVRGLLVDGALQYRLITARRTTTPPTAARRQVDPAVFTAPSALFAPFWAADPVG